MVFSQITPVIAAIVVFAIWCDSADVSARPSVSNSIHYFPVRGTTASSIYTNLVINGPGGQSGSAMATTNATISHVFKLKQGKNCRMNGYRIKVKVVTRLPRLVSVKKLSRSMRRTWRNFNGYVRRHEARHKSIYIACARRIEASARRLARRKSCSGVSSAISRTRYTELAKCERLHSAYDRREFSRIKRLGLIVRASRRTFNRKTRKKKKTSR